MGYTAWKRRILCCQHEDTPFIDVMIKLLTIVSMTNTFNVGGVIPMELPKVVVEFEKIIQHKVVN